MTPRRETRLELAAVDGCATWRRRPRLRVPRASRPQFQKVDVTGPDGKFSAKIGPGRSRKNVLTAKKGHFLGVLAGKRGVDAKKKTFSFALFHVLVVLFICLSLSNSVLQILKGSKKNRAEKPTVGFWFWAGFGNIAA